MDPLPPTNTTPPTPSTPPPPPRSPSEDPERIEDGEQSRTSRRTILISLLVLIILSLSTYLAYDKFLSAKTTSIPTPSPIASPQPSAQAGDPTANWQTCTNTEYGFTIKYPPGYTFDESDCSYNPPFEIIQNLPAPPQRDYVITFTYIQTGLAAEDPSKGWIRKYKCNPLDDLPCSAITLGPISNSLQVDLLQRHYASTETVFRHNTTIFDISLGARNPNTPISPEAKQIYNQILSTFRFTD